ncbi:MAG: CvpA family protein [Clostridiales bacterium]|nr:CvpA family protein [Clostridiales bacterium]
MAILDIVCIAILVVFAVFGAVKGFARQVLKFASGFIAIVGAALLLKPAYDILSSIDAVKSLLDTVSNSVPFGNYVAMAVLFVVLAIVLGLVWKILKKICLPICDLKFFRFFDKLFGFALGAVWGALFAFGILYIASLVAPKVDAVASIYNSIVTESIVKTYIVDNFNKVTEFFLSAWEFIKAGIVSA